VNHTLITITAQILTAAFNRFTYIALTKLMYTLNIHLINK
jgi:hypothetical protein